MTDRPWTPPAIPPLAQHLAAELQARINSKTKPPGALGRLEEMALQLGLMQATTQPDLRKPTVVVFAGDHGLAAEGVSPFPPEVTPQMVANYLAGGAGINVFARAAGLAIVVVDAGVAVDMPPHPGLLVRKVRHGTRNALHEDALTDEEVALCLARGAEVVAGVAAGGSNAILPGEMGIGNTSSAALLTSALAPAPLDECIGIGAGHVGPGLAHKKAVLAKVQQRRPDVRDPLAALAAFGGCEIAMMTGAMLEAASRRMLIVVDGLIATSAALVAARISPAAIGYMLFAHASGDRSHHHALQALGGKPLLDLGLRLGEGTGAALAWPLIAASAGFLAEMATFEIGRDQRADRSVMALAAREARAMWAAAMFFTRLPLPSLPVLLLEDERRATGWWPLIGVGVGALIAGVWWLTARVLPGGVAVGLGLAAGMLFTGAMHEDGFADVCDGFGGGRTRERVLEIMRDSRVGAYGAVGIVMLLGLKWQAMTALPAALLPAAVIAAHALSRGAALAMTATLPYVRTDGRPAQRMTRVSGARLAASAVVALAPLLLLPLTARAACLAVSVAAWAACALWFRRRLEGYTGDCLGATQQIAEVAILLAVLATL